MAVETHMRVWCGEGGIILCKTAICKGSQRTRYFKSYFFLIFPPSDLALSVNCPSACPSCSSLRVVFLREKSCSMSSCRFEMISGSMGVFSGAVPMTRCIQRMGWVGGFGHYPISLYCILSYSLHAIFFACPAIALSLREATKEEQLDQDAASAESRAETEVTLLPLPVSTSVWLLDLVWDTTCNPIPQYMTPHHVWWGGGEANINGYSE